MRKEELAVILENHLHWLHEDVNGWESMRANLTGADLREADLTGANLTEAYLRGANLTKANLTKANLTGAKINYPIACPEEGQFIAWKQAVIPVIKEENLVQNCCAIPRYAYSKMKPADMVPVIIKLLIPEEAKRSSATDRKCRASKAIVLEGYVLEDPTRKLSGDDVICSIYDNNYTYKIGDTLDVPDFNEDRWNECAPGIHFFITRQEAEEYI